VVAILDVLSTKVANVKDMHHSRGEIGFTLLEKRPDAAVVLDLFGLTTSALVCLSEFRHSWALLSFFQG